MPFTLRPLIVFSHGNSFQAAVYSELIQHLKARGYAVEAIEKFGHDAARPVTNNWPHLVRELADFATLQALKKPGQPLFLVGHSLGGFLSLMCASKFPVLGGVPISGVVLLDSPIIGGWRAQVLRIAKKVGLMSSMSPGAVSQKRRTSWASSREAFVHFRAKKSFALWHDAAIHNYVESFSQRPTGGLQLGFDRSVETAIYNTLPDNLGKLLASHPPKCPVAFVGGSDSTELKRVGLRLTQKVVNGRIRTVNGGHLFPIENPLCTAAAIDAELLNIAALSLEPAWLNTEAQEQQQVKD